ncbi:uncharacterized protein LOC144001427 [Festucalex cinctus]
MRGGDSRKEFQFNSDRVGETSEEDIPEKIETEKPLASSRSKDSPTCSSVKHDETEKSWHKEALEAERKAKSTFCEALKKEQRDKNLLRKSLRQERKSNATLVRTQKNEKAKKDGLRILMELMTKHVDSLCKMLERQQFDYTKVTGKLRKMTAKQEKDKKAMETLKKDLEATLHQRKKEIAELERVTCDQVQKLKDQVTKMQEESVEKDGQITSLLFKSQTLQQDIEAKGATVSTLQEKVSQLASEKEELRRDLQTAQNQRHVSLKELQEAKETRSANRGLSEKEQARFQRAYSKLQTKNKKLAVALDKSLAAEKCLRVSLRNEQEHVKKMLLQRDTHVKAIAVLSYEQNEAFAASDSLQNLIRSLRVENACTSAKYKALETEYDKVKSRYHSLSERCKELASKNSKLIFENQAVAADLSNMVDKLRECELECSRSQTQLQKALTEEKERCSELEERAARAADALKKQRSVFEKHSRELENALSKQLQLMDQKQTLSVALQNALDANLKLKKQQEEEAAFHFKKLDDAELKMQQDTFPGGMQTGSWPATLPASSTKSA